MAKCKPLTGSAVKGLKGCNGTSSLKAELQKISGLSARAPECT